jgi:hypothetical protein
VVLAAAVFMASAGCDGNDDGQKATGGSAARTTDTNAESGEKKDSAGGGGEKSGTGGEKSATGGEKSGARGKTRSAAGVPATGKTLRRSLRTALRRQSQRGSDVKSAACGPTHITEGKWSCRILVGRQLRVYKVQLQGSRWRATGGVVPRTRPRPPPRKGKKPSARQRAPKVRLRPVAPLRGRL